MQAGSVASIFLANYTALAPVDIYARPPRSLSRSTRPLPLPHRYRQHRRQHKRHTAQRQRISKNRCIQRGDADSGHVRRHVQTRQCLLFEVARWPTARVFSGSDCALRAALLRHRKVVVVSKDDTSVIHCERCPCNGNRIDMSGLRQACNTGTTEQGVRGGERAGEGERASERASE